MKNIFTEAEQAANVAKVLGTEVTLRRYLGKARPKTARIKGYIPPCVWKLDKPIGSPKSDFQPDREVCLLDGRSVESLIPDKVSVEGSPAQTATAAGS